MLSKYRIGLLEDEEAIAESLVEILEALGHQVLFTADNGEDFLKALSQHDPDLLLLDIQVKGDMNGLQLTRFVGNIPYLFTTAFADDATIQAVKQTDATGYLVKPYGMKDIGTAIHMAMKIQSRIKAQAVELKEDERIFVKCEKQLHSIKLRDIQFLESRGDYVLLQTVKGKLLTHSTLKAILGKLNQDFFQVHRSFVVRLDAIEQIEDQSLVIDGKHIPVSQSRFSELKSVLGF